MKQLLLPIVAAAAFIIAVGLLTKTIELNPPQKKQIKVGNVTLYVEISDSEDERAKGLSGRKSLGENEGMLFVFENSYPSFWMKEMLIPIDILWISDGKVVKIHKNVLPEPEKKTSELTLYRPDGPIDYVLEVNAEFSDKNGIKLGDQVNF